MSDPLVDSGGVLDLESQIYISSRNSQEYWLKPTGLISRDAEFTE